MRRPARVRVVSVVSVLAVIAASVAASQPVAAAASKRPKVQKERKLPHTDLTAARQQGPPVPPPSAPRGARSWPAAGSAQVSLPVSGSASRAVSVRAGSLPILLAGRSGASVRVQLHDHAAAARAGVTGVLFSLTRATASASPLTVHVDYSSFRDAGGANFGQRLHLVTLPACALSTPQRQACQVQTPIASRNDAEQTMLTGTVGGSDSQPAGGAGPAAAPLADAGGSAVVLAAVAGASGSNGTFAASSLAPSGSWSVSGASGDLEWSYPITVPAPASGADVVPRVALSYNSGAVDGRIADTNNQPSWVGEGWGYSPGYIERTYRTCADDTGLPISDQTGDLCWAGQIVSMNLGGHTTALVRDDSTGQWHPARDDGSRVQLLTGSGNGARDGEYWRITTTDGVQYYFGRDRLPAGSAGTQHSVWTVPVYGAHSGDPCHSSNGFAASRCTQAWRWNLDYVEDPHGNATAYSYASETNYYGADKGTSPVGYLRGGYLTTIDYGLHDVNGSLGTAPAPQRVTFTVAERCIPTSSFDCAASKFTAANASHWPDTPQDQACSSSGTCNNHAPTFWSRKRLTTITTAYYSGGTYKAIDSYALSQSFPTAGDPELMLNSIKRVGHGSNGSSITLPTVSFGSQLMDNRVRDYNGQPEMLHWRLTQIDTETGQSIVVFYSQSGRAKPACTASTVPSDPSQDAAECFPVYWTPPFNTKPILDYFHKYVVTEVDVDDANATAPDRYTAYTYLGAPAWHFDDNEVVKPANRSYGQFRGYAKVQTRTGNQNSTSNGSPDQWTLSTATYYRGMDGDKLPGGTRSVTVTDSLGETVADTDAYADGAREVQTFNGSSGGQTSTTITTMGTIATTATRARSGLPALTAHLTAQTVKRAYTSFATGGTRHTTASYRYDNLGRLIARTDSGTAVANVCTTTRYANNTTAWIRDRVAETITSAQACPTSGDPSPILSDARTYYDGSTTLGTVGAHGDATRTTTATSTSGGGLHWAKTTGDYDTYGRTTSSTVYTSSTDTTGRTTATTYTPGDGGPLTKTVTTNPAGQTTTSVLDPARGVVTEAIDVAGHKTDASYDALGRLTAVWKPGQVKGADPATITYAYLLRTTGPLAITTKTLIDPGQGKTPGYHTAISLYDAFGALRQTQADAVGGGRVVTDAYTDSHGWVIATNNRWYTSGTPSATLIGTAESGIDSRTQATYDGAGRVTRSTEYQGTTAKWSTRTVYGGDRTTVIPPTGGVETTTVTDARGHIVELDQWTSPPAITRDVISGGVADKTTYHYTPLGQQDRMTTAAGTGVAATWITSYDLAGRVVSKADPDTGATTSAYDDAGELTTATDARGQTLAYAYDSLGRKTAEYAGSMSGTKLASWTYDTLQAGQLTSSTRYTPDGNYTVAATGYTGAGLPTGSKTTLPASLTSLGFAGSYTTSYTWTKTGLMATQTPAPGGSLSNEMILYDYDSFGDPTSTDGTYAAYVSASSYSPYGEPNQYTLGANNATGWLTYARDAQTRQVTGVNLSAQVAIPQLEDVAYTYDPAGNITRSVDTQGGGQGVPVETTCYRYNALAELTQAWSATDQCATTPTDASKDMVGGVQPYWESWTIDAAGTRTGQTRHALPGSGSADTITTYTAGVSGHAHALTGTSTTGPDGASTTSYAYNAAGQTTTRTGVPGGDQTLTWDAEGRLATATTPAGMVSYTYSADGDQLVRRDPGSTTVYLPGEELTYTTATGTIKGYRYYTHNGTVVAERVGASNPVWLLTDPHGTVSTAVPTGANGPATAIRRHYDPYGVLLAADRAWFDTHTFLNKPQDPTTSLVDLGARNYDPTLGRFLSVDPILDPSDPQSANGYAYADNNPITHSDPTGTRLADCAVGDDCNGIGGGGDNRINNDNGPGAPAGPGNTGTGSTSGDDCSPGTACWHRSVRNDYMTGGTPHGRSCIGHTASYCGHAKQLSDQQDVLIALRWAAIEANQPCRRFSMSCLLDDAKTIAKSLSGWDDFAACLNDHSAVGCTFAVIDSVGYLTIGGRTILTIKDAATLNKLKRAAESGADANAVIGKVKDLGSVGDNEYTLLDQLPNKFDPKLNWQQNSGVLRQEMSRGVPIRDASVDPATGEQLDNTGFLRAERNLLQTKGWTYDPKTTFWSPGG